MNPPAREGEELGHGPVALPLLDHERPQRLEHIRQRHPHVMPPHERRQQLRQQRASPFLALLVVGRAGEEEGGQGAGVRGPLERGAAGQVEGRGEPRGVCQLGTRLCTDSRLGSWDRGAGEDGGVSR